MAAVRDGMRKNMKLLKKTGPVLLFFFSLFLLWLTRQNQDIAEKVFARGFYKYYAFLLSRVTQIVPFSLMELGIVLAPFLAVFILVFFLYKLIKSRNQVKYLKRCLFTVLWTGSIVFFWLTITCNVNYNRYTFGEISGLTIQEASAEELYELCLKLADEAGALRAQLHQEDETGAFRLMNSSVKDMSKTAGRAYKALNQEYGVFDFAAARTKPVFFSKFMSYTDLVGIYCPFTMETNVNMDVADYSIPSTMCHELAHYFGYMREDEANFIGYLACMASDSLEFQYSGTLLALIHAGNQLSSADGEAYAALWLTYSDAVERDLIENSRYWDKLKTSKVREVSTGINDAYLKANNQADGVKSYGRMVDLLLAYYRNEK